MHSVPMQMEKSKLKIYKSKCIECIEQTCDKM